MSENAFEDLSYLLKRHLLDVKELNKQCFGKAVQAQDNLLDLSSQIRLSHQDLTLSEAARDGLKILEEGRIIPTQNEEQKKDHFVAFSDICRQSSGNDGLKLSFLRLSNQIHQLRKSCLRILQNYQEVPPEAKVVIEEFDEASTILASVACWGCLEKHLRQEVTRLKQEYPQEKKTVIVRPRRTKKAASNQRQKNKLRI